MRQFQLVKGVQNLSLSWPRPVVTIGNFDGVHLGHQQIIQATLEHAAKIGGTAVAYTFRPHPQVSLRPEKHIQLLCTYDEKLRLLAESGLHGVIEEPFSREFSQVSPQVFFNDILVRRLSAEAVVVGYDFAFGKGREGHLDALAVLCKEAGIDLTVVQPHKVDGQVVSSSRIRQELVSGFIPNANRLLGREFSYQGVVERGDARGRTIGFPTANIKMQQSKLCLPLGVYATRVRGVNGDFSSPGIASVTNIGLRPTFAKQAIADPAEGLAPLIEAHLLDMTVDLYGAQLEVCFIERIREERKFPGIDALKAQIAKDAARAREIHSGS